MLDILFASGIDILIGDPHWGFHPVIFMGNLLNLEERIIKRKMKSKKGLRLAGFFMAIFNILFVYFLIYNLLKFFMSRSMFLARLLNIYLIYSAISAKSLDVESTKVINALKISLDKARKKLSYIVGRETKYLNEEEIIKAAIETVSENTSDGVIAPILFGFIGGAPLALTYKMVNTMDSMWGYKNKRFIDFGRYPAIIDDVFNFFPSRITAFLMLVSSYKKYDIINGIKILKRDRKKHLSPNAPWPESVVAGLLNIQLGGDNIYGDKIVSKPKIGDDIKKVSPIHLFKTIDIMYRTEILLLTICVFINLAMAIFK